MSKDTLDFLGTASRPTWSCGGLGRAWTSWALKGSFQAKYLGIPGQQGGNSIPKMEVIQLFCASAIPKMPSLLSIIHCIEKTIKAWPKLGWVSRDFVLQGLTERLKLGISTLQVLLESGKADRTPHGRWLRDLEYSGESQNIPTLGFSGFPKMQLCKEGRESSQSWPVLF